MYKVIIIDQEGRVLNKNFDILGNATEYLEKQVDQLDYEYDFVSLTARVMVD
jgi:hypothetical protein